MKKIAMFSMGTRGDIQPYIYLSNELIKSGFEVTFGSHPCWRELIEDNGIIFKQVGPDIDIEKETAKIRGKHSNPMISMLKTAKFIFRIIQDSTNEIYDICNGKDLIIVTHSHMGAVEAEVLGIPTVNVTLQTEMIAEKLKKKTLKNKILGSIIAKQVSKPYNKIRKVYGLKAVNDMDEMMSKQLNLIPISSYVIERNPYWEDKNVITGYWYEEEDYNPPAHLLEFLKSGEKPVILALGAMSFEDKSEKEKLEMFINAFEKTGCRAIIQGFQKTLMDYELPYNMIACGNVPHSWLFKQGLFVIHHCGFGTAAASFIYAIPSIPVPHILDQKGFAKQLYDAGVATNPINAKDLSEERITKGIFEMKQSYNDKKSLSYEISKMIKSEGGVKEAVRLIKEITD